MSGQREVKSDLMRLELCALSEVLKFKSNWILTLKDEDLWKKKILKFREALLIGEGKKKEEFFPHEIVIDEYKVVKHIVDWVKKDFKKNKPEDVGSWIKSSTIPFQCGKGITIFRPFPGLKKTIDMLVDYLTTKIKKRKPSEIAYYIVAERLNENYETIRKKIRKRKRKGANTNVRQRLLVSAFLDHNRCVRRNNFKLVSRNILDALWVSKYYPLSLFYLIKKSQVLPQTPDIIPWQDEMFDKLCKIVNPKRKGIFNKIIHST